MLNNIDIFRKLYPGKSEKGESYVEIDNHVFKLHYKGTVMLLLAMTMLVTTNQLIGNPIECLFDGIPIPLANTFCLFHGTYTVKNTMLVFLVF